MSMGMGTSLQNFKYVVGGVGTNDPTAIKSLVQTVTIITAGQYDSPDSPRGTSYQVTAGKTCYIVKLFVAANSAAAADCRYDVGYGDTHVENSAAAPTNAITVWQGRYLQAGGVILVHDVWIPIPASKYPYFLPLDANIALQAIGIEI